jgi:hypothetical protein
VTPLLRGFAMLLLLALVLAPRASSAQPASSRPSAAADAIGRAHFQRGQRLSASGNYAAAYREFAAGYAATKRPLFLFNMGEAARASGDVAKARDSYLEFLRVDPKSALAATARTRLAELDRAAGITSPRSERVEPVPPPSGAPTTGAPPTGAQPNPPATTRTQPAISTAPGGARAEPLPLRPPSATPPQPTRPASDDSLPPERFTTSRDTEDRPLWKKWPFWAVVGVVAGGAIVFAATRPDATACGTGCTPINFR